MPRMRKVAIVGANKEGLSLLPVLDRDPNVKVVLIADRNPDALVFKLDALGYRLASRYQVTVAPTLDALAEMPDLDLVIDASHDVETAAAIQQKKPPRATVMSALSARLLWGTKDPGAAVRDRSAERHSALFTGLSEIIGAVNLASNQEELLSLVLSVAIESTGAHRGSLLLLDPEEQVLRVRVAEGIDPYVIPTIRIPLGEGISGKVAKEGTPLRISGPANPTLTGAHHIREDVAAALCVPLRASDGRVIGVLNVHHRTDPDAFTDEDLAFLTRLATLEAQIISRSQEFERLRGVAARFDAYREFRERLDAEGPLAERLDGICRSVAARLPGGTCTVYRYDAEAELLVVEGTSQAGVGAPWARGARMSLGQGLEGAVVRERRERRLVDPEGGGLVLAVPLLARSSVEGVLVITATAGSDGQAADLARELKPLLADALRREREQAAAAGKATKLAAITEASLSILTAPSLEELGRVVAASAAMVLEADLAVVRIREEGARFTMKGAYGLPEDRAARRERLAAEQQAAGRASRERRAVREGTWLAIPLLVDGRVAGTIAVADKVADDPFRPLPFGAGDEEILGRLAAYVEQTLKERSGLRAPSRPAPVEAPAEPPSRSASAERPSRSAPATTPSRSAPAAAPSRSAPAAPSSRSASAAPSSRSASAGQPSRSAPPRPSASPRAGAPVSSPTRPLPRARPSSGGAAYLSRRLADELARSRRNGRHVGVIVARLEPERILASRAARRIDPLLAQLGEAFRARLRVYDEVVRVSQTRLAVLLPDAEDGARAVADRLEEAAREDGIGTAMAELGARLAMGVAQAPDDLPPGLVADRDAARALIEHASRK